MDTITSRLRLLCSVVLIGGGAFMLLGAGINRIEKPAENPWGSTILLALIIGVAPVVGGVLLLQSTRRHTTKSHMDAMERTVLQLARAAGGELTAATVATSSTLSLEEAQQILQQLNLKGVNSMDVSDAGILVYRFPEFLRDAG